MGDPNPGNVSSDAPVIEFASGVLDEGVSRGVPSEQVEKPARKGFDGCRGVSRGGVYIGDSGGAGAKGSVAKGSDAVVVELLDPLDGLVKSLADGYLECGIMAIVFHISLGWNAESVFVIFDLFVEAGNSVIE
jgi:hypothetical protein